MRFATCTGIRVHLLLGALLAGVSVSLHAQQGSIAGKVSDASTNEPLENARVVLAGPNRVETTGQDGQYFKIDWDGNVLGAIGNGPGKGEGQFTEASYLVMDSRGNLFTGDTSLNRITKLAKK